MTTLKDKELDNCQSYGCKFGEFYMKEDVKKAVLEFENQLKRAIADGCIDDSLQNVLDEHKRIFGDLEK